ncbi:HAD family hydrolase [Caldalkalibacillus mannanilyticus]|uniref:HAD family hydrolase n=1 Tax=Caldalkalibacillus mannanilyticus TaxID=1418 RepID=UPI0004681938|nr:HAD family hydrolase [Caldalkalibacillus mannanilyticus]
MDSMIFDLDGTLWDSSEAIVIIWNKVFQNMKVDVKITKDDIRGIMGLQSHEIGEKLFPTLDEHKLKQLFDEFAEAEGEYLAKNGGILFDKVEEVLKVLSTKYKLCIVSNCQEGYIEAFYKYHKLEKYFIDFENPGRTGLSKGENIQLVMKRNKLDSPIYVGDTLGDQRAAEFAGVPFVFAEYGFGKVERSDYSIDRFEQLLEIF